MEGVNKVERIQALEKELKLANEVRVISVREDLNPNKF
jgi:hypothetical protein